MAFYFKEWENHENPQTPNGRHKERATWSGMPVMLVLNCNYMEETPSWDSNTRWAGPEILRLLWNLQAPYRIHKISPLVRTLGQTNPVHTFPPYFMNIILIPGEHKL
jgi:hypothetical protein